MEGYLRRVENVCIKLICGFEWPSSESMGKQWLLSLCLKQETKRMGKVIGRKISEANWLMVRREITHKIITGAPLTNQVYERPNTNIMINYSDKMTQENEMICVSVGVQSMALCRRVDRMLYWMSS